MADENENVDETTEEPEAAEPEAEQPEAEIEAAEAEVEEPMAEADATEAAPAAEATAEEPEAEAEAEPVEEPAAEAEAEGEAEAPTTEAEAASEEPAAPARKKKKRLPRSLRPHRTKTRREKPKERRPIVRLPKPEHARGRRQERQGTVVSAATDKTIIVRVDTVKVHPRYKKVIRRSTRLHAHDEQNEAKVGDIVEIVETRPLSKLKRWRLERVVEAAK